MSYRDTIRAFAKNGHRRCVDAEVTQSLRGEPSKAELRAMLAEAAHNTERLSSPTGEEHASDH